MTTTLTLNDLLVEYGSLAENKDQAPMRVGARLVKEYLDTFEPHHVLDNEQLANLLYYLTDIQVRDYALGLLRTDEGYEHEWALKYLLEAAPTDTEYINAPATLLAVHLYELHNPTAAFTTLSNASEDYSLAQLLRRVFVSDWKPEMFQQMRAELHETVTEGIFGESN